MLLAGLPGAGKTTTANPLAAMLRERGPRCALHDTVEAAGGGVEVYVSTPLATCETRAAPGLYARVRHGPVECFTCIDDPYEPPGSPDVEIDATDISPDRAARRVLAALERLRLIRRLPDMAGVRFPAPYGGRDGGDAR